MYLEKQGVGQIVRLGRLRHSDLPVHEVHPSHVGECAFDCQHGCRPLERLAASGARESQPDDVPARAFDHSGADLHAALPAAVITHALPVPFEIVDALRHGFAYFAMRLEFADDRGDASGLQPGLELLQSRLSLRLVRAKLLHGLAHVFGRVPEVENADYLLAGEDLHRAAIPRAGQSRPHHGPGRRDGRPPAPQARPASGDRDRLARLRPAGRFVRLDRARREAGGGIKRSVQAIAA